MMDTPRARGPVIIFTGPSLSPGDAAGLIDADIRPPAAQGDLVAAVLDTKPRAVGLIDGVFQSEPAIRHKEILWAIDQGIPVFGAASMGALRAAELAGFGMIGIGLVYRWYRLTPLAPDDAVAVLHGPPELEASALSDALINLRLTFKACRRQGILRPEAEQRLVAIAERLPYRERTMTAVLDAARAEGLKGLPEHRAIDRYWRDQKRQDAVALLLTMAGHLSSGLWPTVKSSTPFEFTDAWVDDLADAGFSLDDLTGCL